MKHQQSKCFSGIRNFYSNLDKETFDNISCLILSMPFVVVGQPTMGVSVLKSALNKGGISTEVHYPCFPFAVNLPNGLYDWFGSNVYDRIGDYFFSEIIFGKDDDREKEMISSLYELETNSRFPNCDGIDNANQFIANLPFIRELTQSLINEIVNLIRGRSNIQIVCCSATFVQLFPSLAVLKEIKRVRPDIITIIGGCECEGEIAGEIVKNFKFIDYACSGEGDVVLVELCKNILKGNKLSSNNLPFGIYDINKASSGSIESAKVIGKYIAIPDHSNYYKELSYFPQYADSIYNYTFELSRGCWKGQKSHCTFCGLNGMRMDYRRRNVEEVIEEVRYNYNKGMRIFYSVDSVIDLNYMRSIFNVFRNDCPNAIFMCDTVSSLTYEQIKFLADSGVLIITAGIESLHPIHLKLMQKGPRAIGNIAYLKYARMNNMHILWNLLTAIPGDSVKEYEEMNGIIPYLEHLTPPNYSIIRFDRHSLYWENPTKFGLNLTPMNNAKYLYPKDTDINLETFSMYFDNIATDAVTSYKNDAIQNLFALIRRWKECYKNSPTLSLVNDVIIDTRSVAVCSNYKVTYEDKSILNYLFSPKSILETEKFVTANNLQCAFYNLFEKKYLLKWDDAYLSLVTLPISKEREERISNRWDNIDVNLL